MLMAERIVELDGQAVRLSAVVSNSGQWVNLDTGRYVGGVWESHAPLFRVRPGELRRLASALSSIASELGMPPDCNLGFGGSE
jgi:hypothetical protein